MKLYGNVYTHTYVAIFYTLNVAKALYPVYQFLMWQMFFISCTSTPYVIPPCGVFKEIKYDDDDDDMMTWGHAQRLSVRPLVSVTTIV